MAVERLRLDEIIFDTELQFRSETTNEATVARYTEALEGGEMLPPITVYRDDVGRNWVADGFNRGSAHRRAGREEIECDVRDGSRADALTEALKSNEKHGLPRDDEGRIKAMKTFFSLNENMRNASTRALLPHLGMSKRTADRIRKLVDEEMRKEGADVPTTRIGLDGKKRPASHRRAESTGSPHQMTVQPASVSVDQSETSGAQESRARSSADSKPRADRRRDAAGVVVPDHLADIFGDGELHDVIAKVEAALKPLQHEGLLSGLFARTNSLRFLELDHIGEHIRDGLQHFQQALAWLQGAVPHVVCSCCKGSGCKTCKQSGYLPKWRHEEDQEFGKAA